MASVTRSVVRVGAGCLLGWLVGCSDAPPPTGGGLLPQPGLNLSEPQSLAATPASWRMGANTAAMTQTVPGGTVAYVSLTSQTAPGGATAIIHGASGDATTTVGMVDGGFDPVPIDAIVGDEIRIEIRAAGGELLRELTGKVPAKRKPTIVRTVPPRGKTDVPVNSAVIMVFSEPIDATSLTQSSVRLLRGSTTIPGTAQLLDGVTAAAVFYPTAALARNSAYQLVVTSGVRDLDGETLLSVGAIEFTTGVDTTRSVRAVSVTPDTAAIAIGSKVQLLATPRDTFDVPVAGRAVLWSSEDPTVAVVSSTGLVTGVSEGEATIRASVDGWSGVATVLVSTTLNPVASIELSPTSATALVDGFVEFSAVLRDAGGNRLRFRQVTWTSSDPTIAAISDVTSDEAVVRGVAFGTVTITATSEGRSATATLTVGTLETFAQIIAGYDRTCGILAGGSAWCWGANWSGGLGNGTNISTTVPVAVAGSLRFSRIAEGNSEGSGCGLTLEGAAYCWGYNYGGRLGNGADSDADHCGAMPCTPRPVAVAGGHNFKEIAVESVISCAVTQGGAAYCWGDNSFGLLGTGSATGPQTCGNESPFSCATVPAAVTGGLSFASITIGNRHACALGVFGAAYCWGENGYGQLGDGTTTKRLVPTLVAGGHTFVALSAGTYHTCGVRSDGSAYCWGSNGGGMLGIGNYVGPESCFQEPCSTVPRAVAGGLRWSSLDAGARHTCAVTPAGAAYCWGMSNNGEVGNGVLDSFDYASPVAVVGNHVWARISAADVQTCGVTTAGVAYCWGANRYGQLGSGSIEMSAVPLKVSGQP